MRAITDCNGMRGRQDGKLGDRQADPGRAEGSLRAPLRHTERRPAITGQPNHCDGQLLSSRTAGAESWGDTPEGVMAEPIFSQLCGGSQQFSFQDPQSRFIYLD